MASDTESDRKIVVSVLSGVAQASFDFTSFRTGCARAAQSKDAISVKQNLVSVVSMIFLRNFVHQIWLMFFYNVTRCFLLPSPV